jgi:hypothetical protein
MIRFASISMILLAVPLVSASAQELDPAQRVQAALDRAAAAGIPVSLLESKIAEGRAKGVRPDVLAGAIERREVGLLRAREAMSAAAAVSPADLGVGADALEVGVQPEVLRRLAASASSEHRAVAIVALTELVVAGHPAEQALQQVQEALRRGPAALSNLPRGRGVGPPPDAGRGRGPGGQGPPGQGGGAGPGPPAGVPGGGQGQGPGGEGPPGQGGGGGGGGGGQGPGGQGPPGQGGGGGGGGGGQGPGGQGPPGQGGGGGGGGGGQGPGGQGPPGQGRG